MPEAQRIFGILAEKYAVFVELFPIAGQRAVGKVLQISLCGEIPLLHHSKVLLQKEPSSEFSKTYAWLAPNWLPMVSNISGMVFSMSFA